MVRRDCKERPALRWITRPILFAALGLGAITVMMFVIPHAGAAFKYVKAGMDVPDISVETMKGESLSLTELRESPAAMIIFWSTWSGRSKPALEKAESLFREHADKGFRVLAINVDSAKIGVDDKQKINTLAQELGLTIQLALDQGYQAYNTFGVVATPSFAILDANGTIVHEAASYRKSLGEELAAEVEILLGLREPDPEEKAVEEVAYKPVRKALLYYNLGRNLLTQGNREKAMRKLEDSAEADKKFSAPRVLLGHLLLGEQSPEVLEQAEKLFREAVEIDPENVSALTGLGEALLDLERTEEAAVFLEKAVALDDTYTPAVANMAYILAAQGKFEEAKQRFEAALELNPLDPSTYQRRGESAEIKGDMSQAASDYRRAIEIMMEDL